MNNTLLQKVESLLSEFSFEDWGCTTLEKPLSLDVYKQWVDEGMHGEMRYLKTHIEAKEQPKKLLDKAQSAIVFLKRYQPHPRPTETPVSSLRTALYAQGEDYHYWFKREIHEVAQRLEEHFPNEHFLAFTDSSPILERDLAHRAGLGWFGKNSCLLSRNEGSLFFIGELYTTLQLEPESQELPLDFCGKCTRCIDVCPTSAIVAPRKLDANLCISYLTIESKKVPPPPLRKGIGDWFFGCDLCQTVCPWNEKNYDRDLLQELSQREIPTPRGELIKDLTWILTESNKSLQRHFKNTALSRTTGKQMKRNALIVAANKSLFELGDLIATFLQDPYLGELAQWALEEMQLTDS